uniref:Glycoside hydrolase 35 catalytic domain-containing protein n=1 Tax=Sus scrofa TaxID=9823 RepID=A0A8D0RMG9_PIG
MGTPRDYSDRHVGLTIRDSHFMLGDFPFLILAGTIHYFRVPKEYWRDSLLKLKACGSPVSGACSHGLAGPLSTQAPSGPCIGVCQTWRHVFPHQWGRGAGHGGPHSSLESLTCCQSHSPRDGSQDKILFQKISCSEMGFIQN